MTTNKPLTNTQMLVLTNAAQRSNLFVLPLPTTVQARGSVKRNLLAALLKMEFAQESIVDDAALAWRTDEEGQRFALRLTPAGYLATCPPAKTLIDATGGPAAKRSQEQPSVNDDISGVQSIETTPAARTPAGKLGQVLQAISGEGGATLTELTALTGWLRHTARAALTGLRQRGFPIQLVQADGRKAYRRAAGG
jgi:hypothetical protein